MNIKIFCRCSLFPSWSGYGLIRTPVECKTNKTTQISDYFSFSLMTVTNKKSKVKKLNLVLEHYIHLNAYTADMKYCLTFKAYWSRDAPTSLTFNNWSSCPHCIYVFCIYLRTNSDLCHLQHKLISFYNRDEKCLQRGTDWGFK